MIVFPVSEPWFRPGSERKGDLSAGDADLVEVQAKMHQGLVVLQGHRQCLVTPKKAACWHPKKNTAIVLCVLFL